MHICSVYCKRHHSAVYSHMPQVLSVYVLIKWYIFQRNTPKSILRRFCKDLRVDWQIRNCFCLFVYCIWDKIVIYVIKSKIFQLASCRAFKKHLMQLFLKSQIEQINKCRYILMQNLKIKFSSINIDFIEILLNYVCTSTLYFRQN